MKIPAEFSSPVVQSIDYIRDQYTRHSGALLGLGLVVLAHDALMSNPISELDHLAEYGRTADHQQGNFIIQLTDRLACEVAGMKTGNAAIDDESLARIAEHPIKSALRLVGAAPITEESLFRVLISKAADTIHPAGRGRNRWTLGALSSLVFAAAHGIRQREENIYPVEQFIAGMSFWQLQRTRGARHAVFAHVTQNAVAYPLTLLGAKVKSIQSKLP
jgi:hypothetical protein